MGLGTVIRMSEHQGLVNLDVGCEYSVKMVVG